MTSLLTIRDRLKSFFSRYDVIMTPIGRFVAAFIILIGTNALFGYSAIAGKMIVVLAISLICAFFSEGVLLFLVGAVMLLHCYSVSLEAAGVFLLLFIVLYFMYVKYCPKTAYVVLIAPLLYMMHIHYALPILVAITVGPVGIVPAAFGVVLYYFSQYLAELDTLLLSATEDDNVQSFTYLISGMMQDKKMILTMLVFAVVVLVTYVIYRLSFNHSWAVAIAVGCVIEIIMFLFGSYAMEAEIDLGAIVVGVIISVGIAFVVQFFKGTVDYTRAENVQFEDDEYYYYVKAIPKLTVSSKNVNVKKIN